jgi:thiosulfate dehydrogenase [quinone] large subunit
MLDIYTKLLLALLRVSVGFIFLWAFLDKTFGLGFSTVPAKAWINGGSPTGGYLANNQGFFSQVFNSMSDSPVVVWLFMLGLLGVGFAYFFGIGMKIASVSGALMMFFIYLSQLPIKANPFLDQHLIYILLLILLARLQAGEYFGLGVWWKQLNFVKNNNWLQ